MTLSLQPTVSVRTIFAPVRLFELTEPFSGILDGYDFVVPKGFITDFASVPRAFESVVPNDNPHILRPAIVHDWLYQSQGQPDGFALWLTRKESDEVLREGMRVCGASCAMRWLVYAAVRAAGGMVWQRALARSLFMRYELSMYRNE